MSSNDVFIVLALTTLIVLLLVAGVAIISIRSSHRYAKQQVLLAHAQAAFEKELRQVEAEVSETMMERFAQELHDNIGHHLTLIRLIIENLKLDHPTLEPTLLPVDNVLSAASQQLRSLSRTLNTEYVSDIGLADAIKLEIERVQQLGRFNITWNANYEHSTLSKNQELLLFRIFQEILQNIIRHSKAAAIFISLSDQDDHILRITDDGQGFSMERIMHSSDASGLKNIRKRAALAGLECIIETSSGNGCTYHIFRSNSFENPLTNRQ